MHPILEPYFRGHDDLYPVHLPTKFARIFDRMMMLWGTPELDTYIDSLVIDERGSRRGFPFAVMRDIWLLWRLHDRIRQHKEDKSKTDPWIGYAPDEKHDDVQHDSLEDFFRALYDLKKKSSKRWLDSGAAQSTTERKVQTAAEGAHAYR